MPDLSYPADLRYTPEHEWARPGPVIRVGITAYAQDALGDIVYVSLPEEGAHLEAGQACGEVESTKSVSAIYSPISGTVQTRNPALDDSPELVNSDPYGDGWMFDVQPDDPHSTDGLMSAEEYRAGLG